MADDEPTRTNRYGSDDSGGVATSAVEFRDCETVRITEPAADVILSLFWWDENGVIGNIVEPVGRVEDERTVSASQEFGTFATGPIVTEVELFDPGTPIVPGGGDTLVSNPDLGSCVEAVRQEYDGDSELEPVDLP